MSANNYSLSTTKKQRQFHVTEGPTWLNVKMYSTNIVVLDKQANTVTLNTNGWKTSTTKAAINNALKQLGSRLYIKQTKGVWYIQGMELKNVVFIDGMSFSL